jgi:hypothetical protein
MAKEKDVNDILRGEGEDGVRAYHASAEPFDENNPKFQNGEASSFKAHKEQLLQSSAVFTRNFTPPDFLIEGILCRQYIYALTGHPGRGKTGVALFLAAHVATGKSLGNLEVDKGRVLILAGENPVDAKMRWIAMGQQMDFDIETVDVHFIEGVFKLSQNIDTIRREVEALDGVDFVIVDSSAAFFEGDDENNNAQQGAHARVLRELTTLKGGPCVLVLCHPPKNAGDDNLQPRGAGAYIAEIDGNLTVSKDDMAVVLHYQAKMRGPDFAPVNFLLKPVTHERLKDSKGRLMPTVVAQYLSEAAQEEMATAARADEDRLLQAVSKNPSASVSDFAKALGWFTKKGDPYKSKVDRKIKRLRQEKLINKERDRLTLTEKGKKALKEAA